VDIHDGKCSLYGPHSQGRKPLRIELMLIANPIPDFNLSLSNPILQVATVKRALTFTAMFTYRHVVNCSKLIKVKLHGK